MRLWLKLWSVTEVRMRVRIFMKIKLKNYLRKFNHSKGVNAIHFKVFVRKVTQERQQPHILYETFFIFFYRQMFLNKMS